MTSTETAAAPTFHHFVVWAPDKIEEGTFEKRLSVRSHHLEGLSKLIGSGDVKVGGVLLTPQSVETATSDKKMTGSMLIFQAENIEKIRVIIESDVYYTSGVWDPEKLVICPFMPALPLP
ncbi:hypothetical protein FIBSPDRAFT_874564 [Athelia psychrophila]|uniref:YCII-related domain-containing protein n=1 Tax=Athelia psychrophila TaxID=1759441 RepID=A0A165XDX6_9AGAM|nr:hypothetical protein FIBSPDRAFT_874564 [Fibularhizoctonia sp. CBS 109695]